MPSWDKSLYQIMVGGNDVSESVAPYLLSVEVTDKAGSVSDTARVLLDDQGGRFSLPQKGEPFLVSLGTVQKGMGQQFNGVVDTVRSKLTRGGGLLLEITGKSMDTTKTAKQPAGKHKDDATLGDAAAEFAKIGGLSGITVHPDLASIMRPYWNMDGESIVAWGRRIASEVGGTFKIIEGDKGVMVPRSAGVSASGKPLIPIIIARGVNLISADIAPMTARPVFSTVRGRYYDPKQAKWLYKDIQVEGSSGSSGGSSVTQRLSYSRADEGDAEKSAGGEAKDSERDKGGGRVEIDGEPGALAEAPCTVQGIREGVDGSYTADAVHHKLDRSSGYTVGIDLVKPEVGGS